MHIRLSVILSAAALLSLFNATPSEAENKIQAYVNSSGRIVFTNMVDNTPPPVAPVLADRIPDVLADEMPATLRPLVDSISANYGVDAALVRAVMKTESNFNRWARSPKGALGLMQLIPPTGRRFGVIDFYDPQQNIEGGVKYLRFLLDKFNGNIDLALAGYNAGENLVERLGRIPAIPETTNYVRKIRAMYKKKSASVTPPTVIAAAVPEPEPAAAMAARAVAAAPAKNEGSPIYRKVDERGVVHFSNIAPPN